jgi:hypothetical protein
LLEIVIGQTQCRFDSRQVIARPGLFPEVGRSCGISGEEIMMKRSPPGAVLCNVTDRKKDRLFPNRVERRGVREDRTDRLGVAGDGSVGDEQFNLRRIRV